MKRSLTFIFIGGLTILSCQNAQSDEKKTEVYDTSVTVNENVMQTKGEILVAYYPKDEELNSKFSNANETFEDFEKWYSEVAIKVATARGLEISKSSEDNIMVEVSPKERFTLYRPALPTPYGLYIIKSGSTPITVQGLAPEQTLNFKLDSLNNITRK